MSKWLLVFLLLLGAQMHVARNIQSPYTNNDFWAQWNSVNPRMGLFVKITPQAFWESDPIGFTSCSRDMVLPGHAITFKSSPAITPTEIEQILGEATTLEMTGIYQLGIFERSEVIAGKWAFADIEIFSASWDNVNLGELLHFKGNLGEFKDYQYYFTAEGRGQIARLSSDVSKVTQRSCRVKQFRDAECGHTATTVTIDGTAYNVTQAEVTGSPGSSVDVLIFDTSTWAGNNPPPNSLFTNGTLTCTSGPNAGASREIAAIEEATGGYPYIAVYLKRQFYFEFDSSETFNFIAGCCRTLEDCRKFGNASNFRGEAFVPGIEAANRTPSRN